MLYEHPATGERHARAVHGGIYEELRTDDLGQLCLIGQPITAAVPRVWWHGEDFVPTIAERIPDPWLRGAKRMVVLKPGACSLELAPAINDADLIAVGADAIPTWLELGRTDVGVRFEYRDRRDLKQVAVVGPYLREFGADVSGDPLGKYKPVNDESLPLLARAVSLRSIDLRYRAEGISDEGLRNLRSLDRNFSKSGGGVVRKVGPDRTPSAAAHA